MLNKKISNLVSRQLPGFVREQHPRFVSFLEAYYEFLEKEHPELNIANNNVLEQVEKLRYVSDVDVSLEKFEEQFFNTFLPYFSKNSAANKDIIIKNIMPLYLAKGSEKSFKLLFRMLFDESVQLSYPRDYILRASDGKWFVQTVLNISDYFYTAYTADGVSTDFYLPEVYDLNEFTVYLNEVEFTDFIFLKEYKKIKFETAPALNSIVKIVYKNFNPLVFQNNLITGSLSGATCIVEYINKTRTGLKPYYEVFIDSKNVVGSFSNNETLVCILRKDVDIPIYFKPYSILDRIDVIDGGASYNVGDIVPVYGEADQPASAIIDSIYTGYVKDVNLFSGGAGFKVSNKLVANGYSEDVFLGSVVSVDSSGTQSANTLTLNNDVIANSVSFLLSDVYTFFTANTSATIDTPIQDALANITISDLGPITFVNVSTSFISSTLQPTFDVIPPSVTANLNIRDFGVIAKIGINNGGSNYANGEYIIFTDNGSFRGYGANAQITGVNANGSITQITLHNAGFNYDASNLPTLTVDTTSGVGANLAITAIMGDMEDVRGVFTNENPGQIKTIKLLTPGLNYTITPSVDLTQLGNGLAKAEAVIKPSVNTLPGRWKTDEGKLSNRDIRLQGNDYYIDYSYVISAGIEFNKYKDIVKNLLHPAGLVNYAKFIAPEVQVSSVINENIESEVGYLHFGIPQNVTTDMTIVQADSTFITVDNV